MASKTQLKKSGLDKNNKYDRQLRLWGDHGQNALEAAKVCLVNASATGTEILKNLILPGIGSFTIVDGNKISGEDLGNNFFLDADSLGKPRAQVTAELLQELNEDVNSDFVEETVEHLLENSPDFFTAFSCVIVTNTSDKTLLRLSSYLWDNKIPLVICKTYGLIGYLRLVINEHTVIEAHPDNAHEDLRLDHPFPGLIEYCDSMTLDTMTKKEHSHTPWLVIIYKYVQKWKLQHDGKLPQNFKEKKELKEIITSDMLSFNKEAPEPEENFEEAVKAVNTALNPTSIPSEVLQVLNDESCLNLHADSKEFWILARAIKDFVELEGQGILPLRGTIPDMTADSERYVQLQNVYRSQASENAALICDRVQQILQQIGRTQDYISESYMKKFCKNAHFLRVIRHRSLQEEYDPSKAKTSEIANQLEMVDFSDGIFYVLLRAVERFYSEHNRYPGYFDDQIETDVANLKNCVLKLFHEWGITPNLKDDYIHEMCRYGGAEPHSVAAFMGGVAAQEVIKLVTEQYIPINNTYIYNAMKQTSTTIEF